MMNSAHENTPYTRRGRKALWALALTALVACGSGDGAAGRTGAALFELTPEASVEVGAQAGRHLVALRRTVNFGPVWQGAVREVRFPLMSTGTEPVRIKNIKVGCGCTLVSTLVIEAGGERPLVMDEPLKPGTRIEVALRYDSRGRAGLENKSVTVYADSPEGRLRLEVGVDTQPFLIPSESPLTFGRLFPTENEVASVEIHAADGQPFGLRLAANEAIPEGLALELKPSPSGNWTLEAHLDQRVAPGNLFAHVTLVSDRPFEESGDLSLLDLVPEVFDEAGQGQHYLDMWVSASVVAPVEMTPVYLGFGFVANRALSSASTRIECFDPGILDDFVDAEPEIEFRDQEGAPLQGPAGEAFTPTWRLVKPGDAGARPLASGVLAAWDLEVAVVGFSGSGQNRLLGQANITFKGSYIPDRLLEFQVILQP